MRFWCSCMGNRPFLCRNKHYSSETKSSLTGLNIRCGVNIREEGSIALCEVLACVPAPLPFPPKAVCESCCFRPMQFLLLAAFQERPVLMPIHERGAEKAQSCSCCCQEEGISWLQQEHGWAQWWKSLCGVPWNGSSPCPPRWWMPYDTFKDPRLFTMLGCRQFQLTIGGNTVPRQQLDVLFCCPVLFPVLSVCPVLQPSHRGKRSSFDSWSSSAWCQQGFGESKDCRVEGRLVDPLKYRRNRGTVSGERMLSNAIFY